MSGVIAILAIPAIVCALLGIIGLGAIAAADWLDGIIRCPGCDAWRCTCRNRRKDGAR